MPEGSRREGGQNGVMLSVVLRASAQARPFGPAGVNTARHNVHRPARRRSRSARPQARQAARCESSGRSVVRRGKAKVGRRQALLQGHPACRTCGSSRSRADPTIMICIHARTHESGLCFVVEHLMHLTGFCESCSVQNLFDPTKVLGSIGPSNHASNGCSSAGARPSGTCQWRWRP